MDACDVMISATARAATLLAVLSLFTFAIAEWTPGDYLSTLRLSPEISPETLEAMRRRLGLNQGWLGRYLSWAASAMTGDFGLSLAYGVPVSGLLSDRMGATLRLNLTSTAAAWLGALILGSWAARQGGFIARAANLAQALLLGVPEILLALVGLWWFGGIAALPYVVLALGVLPVLTIHVRTSVSDALAAPSVTAARLHGIQGARLWWSYVYPLAAPPLLSLAGLSLGGLLSASLLVEAALEVPGLGSLLLDSIQARDTAVVAAIVAIAGITLIASNLAADLLRRSLDPRPQAGAR